MKNVLLPLLITLFVVSCNSQQKTKIIDYPIIGSSNTNSMEIYRIETTDTALILHTEVYNSPGYWIRLSSQSYLKGETSGKIYKLTGSPDFELDKEIYMPESGNKTATLLFEPVDDMDKIISYYEQESGDGFCFRNIHLTKPKEKSGIACVIEGETVDRPYSSRLILARKGTDLRIAPFISIPIRNGKFSYTLHTDINDTYELIFWDEYSRGGWMPAHFLSENGKLNFTFYPMDSKPHVVIHTEAPFNKEIIRMNHLLDSVFDFEHLYAEYDRLSNEDHLYNDTYKQWMKEAQSAKTDHEWDLLYKKRDELTQRGMIYTEEGKALNEQIKLLGEKRKNYILNYIKENIDIVGFHFLNELTYNEKLSMKTPELTPYINIFETFYRSKFPNHPLTDEMNTLIVSNDIQIGSRYINFTAPDLKGNPITLSEKIKGQIALIDLWASWCGPCRRTSISMIPIYEEFKDKGFTIIGIARERDNTTAMEKAIANDKYPWMNLVELNDNGKIWERYGVGNAGGKTFLVDADGIILAIHPTAEEVKAILLQKL